MSTSCLLLFCAPIIFSTSRPFASFHRRPYSISRLLPATLTITPNLAISTVPKLRIAMSRHHGTTHFPRSRKLPPKLILTIHYHTLQPSPKPPHNSNQPRNSPSRLLTLISPKNTPRSTKCTHSIRVHKHDRKKRDITLGRLTRHVTTITKLNLPKTISLVLRVSAVPSSCDQKPHQKSTQTLSLNPSAEP